MPPRPGLVSAAMPAAWLWHNNCLKTVMCKKTTISHMLAAATGRVRGYPLAVIISCPHLISLYLFVHVEHCHALLSAGWGQLYTSR